MSKRDRTSVRTPVDLERKYDFEKRFVLNEELDQDNVFNRLTNYGKSQGVFKGADGNIYINASYLVTGILQSKDKETFYLDLVNGVLKGRFTELSISGKTIDEVTSEVVDSQTQEDVFNKLTNGGEAQGIFYQDGELYINASYLVAGILQSKDKETFYLDLANNILKFDVAGQSLTRPNLLDNWYFGNPVNQRGQTEYTETGYTIDRWKMELDVGNIIVESDGLLVDASLNAVTLFQPMKPSLVQHLIGKTVTYSMEYTVEEGSSGLGSFGFGEPAQYIPVITTDAPMRVRTVTHATSTISQATINPCWGYFPKGCRVKIHSIKMELGDTQTLAHLDASGNWVLNEIPNYAEQLAICSQYDPVTGEYKGVYGWTKLWENAAPTSNFSKQTIAVNLSAYDQYMIMARAGTGYNYSLSVTSKPGVGASVTGGWGDNGIVFHRSVVYADTGLTFNDAYYNKSANNSYVIPLAIYGIKGVT